MYMYTVVKDCIKSKIIPYYSMIILWWWSWYQEFQPTTTAIVCFIYWAIMSLSRWNWTLQGWKPLWATMTSVPSKLHRPGPRSGTTPLQRTLCSKSNNKKKPNFNDPSHLASCRRRADVAIVNDPEVRSILDEISQHFQEFHEDIQDTTSSSDTEIKTDYKRETSNNKNELNHQNNSDASISSQHLKDTFSLYDEADLPVILDVHEELELLQRQEADDAQPTAKPSNWPIPNAQRKMLQRQRGVKGVFDIEELVDVLSAENAQDVCVVKVAPELMYTDYLVLASGRSVRHLRAIVEFVNKLYKAKKHIKDEFVIIQGAESKTWTAMDMGNIVLHMFMPEERSKYDIETLWSVGPDYDDLCQRSTNIEDDKLKAHLRHLEDLRPLPR